MRCIIEYLILVKTLTQYNVLNKEAVKRVVNISEEESNKKNEIPVIIETLEYSPLISATEKSIMSDIIEEAFKIMNRDYVLKYCQWAVCLYNLDKCEVWGILSARYTEERAKKYLFSDPIVNTKFKFFYNKELLDEEKIDYNTLKDLRYYLVGIIPGYFYVEKIKENFPFIKWFISEESQLQGLLNGSIQLAPMNEIVGWYLINEKYPNDVEKFATLDRPLTTEIEEKQQTMICKNYPDAEKILEEYNNAIKILKDTGVIQKIIEKYGAEQYVEVSK